MVPSVKYSAKGGRIIDPTKSPFFTFALLLKVNLLNMVDLEEIVGMRWQARFSLDLSIIFLLYHKGYSQVL